MRVDSFPPISSISGSKNAAMCKSKEGGGGIRAGPSLPPSLPALAIRPCKSVCRTWDEAPGHHREYEEGGEEGGEEGEGGAAVKEE
jgi:hypothetical protein